MNFLSIFLLLLPAILFVAMAFVMRRFSERVDGVQKNLREHEDRLEAAVTKIQDIELDMESRGKRDQEILSLLNQLAKSPKGANKAEVDAVVAEVKVLQTIVEQLTRSRAIGGGIRTTIAKAGKTHDMPVEQPPVIRTDYDQEKILQVVQAGLRSDRVDLYIQPIVSLPQRKIRHFECFSRIRDEEGGIILPEQYMTVAADAGLLAAIDNMLLFRCVQLIRRANINNFHGNFFCNLSMHTLHDAHFFEDFLMFLKDNKELAGKLVFEVGQRDFDERDVTREKLLLRLHESGCRLALSSVVHARVDVEGLHRCRFKYVKLESGVIHAAIKAEPPLDLKIMRRVINNHDMDLIIERIESEQALLDMLEFDIDFGQGFLFGEPKLSNN